MYNYFRKWSTPKSRNSNSVYRLVYGLDDRVSILGWAMMGFFVSSPPPPNRFWGPPVSYSMCTEGFYPKKKSPEREADQWPPSSVGVKNEWSYTSTSQYIFKFRYRDNL